MKQDAQSGNLPSMPKIFTPVSRARFKPDELGAWTIQAKGTFAGKQDDDRVYHGHERDLTIRVDFDKPDRVGFREADSETTAGIVDRYADE